MSQLCFIHSQAFLHFFFIILAMSPPWAGPFPDPHLAKRQRTMDRGVIGKTFQGQTDEEIFFFLLNWLPSDATGG